MKAKWRYFLWVWMAGTKLYKLRNQGPFCFYSLLKPPCMVVDKWCSGKNGLLKNKSTSWVRCFWGATHIMLQCSWDKLFTPWISVLFCPQSQKLAEDRMPTLMNETKEMFIYWPRYGYGEHPGRIKKSLDSWLAYRPGFSYGLFRTLPLFTGQEDLYKEVTCNGTHS